MKILVYMKDGRQVFFLDRRGLLSELVKEPLDDERRTIWAGRGIWNPITGEYVWSNVGLRYISRGSIALVEEAPRGLEDAIPKRPVPVELEEDMVVQP